MNGTLLLWQVGYVEPAIRRRAHRCVSPCKRTTLRERLRLGECSQVKERALFRRHYTQNWVGESAVLIVNLSESESRPLSASYGRAVRRCLRVWILIVLIAATLSGCSAEDFLKWGPYAIDALGALQAVSTVAAAQTNTNLNGDQPSSQSDQTSDASDTQTDIMHSECFFACSPDFNRCNAGCGRALPGINTQPCFQMCDNGQADCQSGCFGCLQGCSPGDENCRNPCIHPTPGAFSGGY